ncbi:BTAD domain-containing putative transcriptional regulator [Actinomadura sp. DC4]|uniref:AfsR/SARP family transcriptional regulator n=1 Tax=Actinomadura sp. DC4 TaxID=3055069 RepID=UPI0025AFC08D|nr:BTAD domain-containing putative transcriptional regulator [Actinomadura sp. DC4]MDN3357266.1 BTAD domain-containing putative transcriptional regulator [Actinomadura sp. DC4]
MRIWRGDVELDAGPWQQRCLLALLLARVGSPISMTELIDLLWADDPPASAVNVIHKYVGGLRRLLEPGLTARAQGSWLTRHGNGYRLVAGADHLDLAAFRSQVERARASLSDDRPDDALDHYVQGLRLWQGPPGDGLAESAAATAVLSALEGELFEAAMEAAELAMRRGHPARVLPLLRRAAGLGPLNEPVQAFLVRVLAAAGQQAEALSVFQTVRDRLADELGIDPGSDLREAHRQVLAQSAAGPENREIDRGPTWVTPLVRPAQLPPDLPNFVGREAELSTLTELFENGRRSEDTSPLIVAMDGMGGVGKSTLALRFAGRIAGRLTDGHLHLDLRGNETEALPVADALRSLLHALGVPAQQIPDTFDSLVGMYRSLTAGKNLLLLLDSARDVAQVRPLLPNSGDGVVLVTSRTPLVGLAAFDGAHLLHVDVPGMQEAHALLERRLPPLPPGSRDAFIDEIITSCGRLPLALAIVAARISAHPRLSPAAVAAELRDADGLLGAFPSGQGVSDPRTAFAWSYQRLSAGAARLFRLSSLTMGPDVSAAAYTSLAGLDPRETRELLRELSEVALLEEHGAGRFSSHVLVKAYARELCAATETEPEREEAATRLLQHYLHSSFNAQVVLNPHRTPIQPPPAVAGVRPERPGSYDDAMAWFAVEHDVLGHAVREAAEAGHGVVPWQLALTLQQYLQWTGFFYQWADVMRTALSAARRDGDRLGEAHVLRSMAGARFFLGAYEEARDLLRAPQEIFTEFGCVLEQGYVHTNMGDVLNKLGLSEEALKEHEQALDRYRTAENYRAEVRALSDIADTFGRLGYDEQAIDSLQDAIRLNEEIGNPHEAGEVRVEAGKILARLGRLSEGAEQLELAVRTMQRVGEKSIRFEASVELAHARLALGETERAREAWASARSLMLTFQNGGTDGMRVSVDLLRHALGASAVPDPED